MTPKSTTDRRFQLLNPTSKLSKNLEFLRQSEALTIPKDRDLWYRVLTFAESGEKPVADKYRNFDQLSRNESSGIDFRILVRRARTAFAIVAPHGGGIEPGTSEIADGIAALEETAAAKAWSYYAFEGVKSEGNAQLHITSTRFDEPMCLTVVGNSTVVITIHGEHSEEDGEGVFVGGRNTELGDRLSTALKSKGFVVKKHPDRRLQGLEPKNICNRGTAGAGVQLEMSQTIRREMFRSLSHGGRKHPTAKFRTFVAAIRTVLDDEPESNRLSVLTYR